LKEGEKMNKKTTQRSLPSSKTKSSKEKEREKRQPHQRKRKGIPLALIAIIMGMMSTDGRYI